MSKKMVELAGRSVLADGTVAYGRDALVRLAREGLRVRGLTAADPAVAKAYNAAAGNKMMKTDIDASDAPPVAAWTTPEPWASMDVRRFCLDVLGGADERYADRLGYELDEMERRGMFPMVRHSRYLVETWREKGVVWGVGRGSSCASLVLYLVGLHRVDPVKYDIPIREFLK